jgi:hypothetical protein
MERFFKQLSKLVLALLSVPFWILGGALVILAMVFITIGECLTGEYELGMWLQKVVDG